MPKNFGVIMVSIGVR